MTCIADILKNRRISFSFEFFPPKDRTASELLFQSISELIPLQPAYVSVTYGAGGSTVDLTHDIVTRLQRETGLTVVSHLTCVGTSFGTIKDILDSYYDSGIRNIMALRGDMPKGGAAPATDFRYAADLVAYIKKSYPDMGTGVAGFPEGHPETPNRLKEIDYLKAKVDAGADYICTQLFFDNRDFYDFRERCLLAGINIPIIAGIMPVTNRRGMERMAELALGARYPARLLKAFSRVSDDKGFENVGIHWATEQVRDLIDNDVKGIHFFTLNKSRAALKIYESLGVIDSSGLSGDANADSPGQSKDNKM
jgi:methylenetetrahydrofolate reductase (NADPH)